MLLSGCDLQKDIDVELPALPAQLVTECYLEDGQIPRLTVTETTPYLASPVPVLPTDVTVVLTLPSGRHDTLRFRPGIDSTILKGYTHIGSRPLVARPGDTFRLEVYDTKGRRVTGTATMPGRIPIDSLRYKFNDKPTEERKAYLLTSFTDPAATADFYRLQIHKDSISTDRERDFELDDRLNNGKSFTVGTSYQFQAGDTLLVTLYHIDQPYYLFRQSVRDARDANGNPFAQPSAIRSTVQGGVGVFTVLSYDRKQIILR
ncbi:DUF4249 domain-containing protein [Microvirga sp. STR05]|uniref:DUF4249 domain-containing protein n=1 Tax=Hymenobacter duratus TaxID=2771356 RepID=A0ABR8JJC4_9BACT|nr:DUF4249 domain-containing protein [Hymenobacter duratus]MBD2715480.1 DUF4249 domain-containing protein [Hymenobacter duratus]MBR7950388.1 DUF4249 domain-containing protein [Microvirga sp. STR05]